MDIQDQVSPETDQNYISATRHESKCSLFGPFHLSRMCYHFVDGATTKSSFIYLLIHLLFISLMCFVTFLFCFLTLQNFLGTNLTERRGGEVILKLLLPKGGFMMGSVACMVAGFCTF